MNHLETFLLGILWSAAAKATREGLNHPLAPARIDVASRFHDLSIRLGWRWAPYEMKSWDFL